MHRTPGTILATSQNKVKTSFPSPLLHTGERVQHSNQSSTTASHRRRGPLSTASHMRKSLHWVPRYGKPHTTFNSIKNFQVRKNTLNMQHIRVYKLPTKFTPSHHAWEIMFHNINPSTYQIIHSSNELNV